MTQQPLAPQPTPKKVLAADDVRRAVTRIAHEIIERNRGLDGVVIVGLQRGGVWIAEQLAAEHRPHRASRCPSAPSMSRCTATTSGCAPSRRRAISDLPVAIDGATVVLVDDVLFTGRTVRAALDALADYGRPRAVQLAVLVDRGHRELPIRPDYVGKNLPTSLDETVDVTRQAWDLMSARDGE